MKKMVAGTVIALVLVIGIVQITAASPGDFTRLLGGNPTKIAADLELTDEQTVQIKDLQVKLQQTLQEFQQELESILTPEQLEKAKSLHDSRRNFGPPLEELELTDEQRSQIETLRTEMEEETKELRDQLRDAMHELRDLKTADNPDQEAVKAKMENIKELQAQLEKITQEYQEQFTSILTSEQLEKVKSMPGFGIRGAGKFPGFGSRPEPGDGARRLE